MRSFDTLVARARKVKRSTTSLAGSVSGWVPEKLSGKVALWGFHLLSID